MPSTNAPFGLQPIYHPSGQIRPFSMWVTKAIAEAMSSLYENQPVLINAAGGLTPVTANNVDFVGVFIGVMYTDNTTGRPILSNQWVTGTTVKNLGANSVKLTFTRDPAIIYQIQANGALAAADIGSQLGFVDFTSQNQGMSQCRADISTLVNNAQSLLRIIGKGTQVDNDWADSYPIIQVGIARHQDVYNKVAY